MRGSPRTSWTIAVILFFQTLLLCASPSQESTDRHAVRVVPANAPSQVLAGVPIDAAGFMRQSFVPGPACILSADQLVLTDIENQDVYLYSPSTGEAQRIAAFGAGPGEIGTIVDVQRVGEGFAVIDGGMPVVVGGMSMSTGGTLFIPGSAIEIYDSSGRFVRSWEVGVGTGLSQIAQLSLLDDQAIALDHSSLLEPPTSESSASRMEVRFRPEELRVIVLAGGDVEIVSSVKPWEQKYTITSDSPYVSTLLTDTLMAVSPRYLILANRFLRFFAVYDRDGRTRRLIDITERDTLRTDYDPNSPTARCSQLFCDIAVDEQYGLFMPHAGRFQVPSNVALISARRGRIDLWDLSGELRFIFYTDDWVEHIDVFDGVVLAVDSGTGRVWLYDLDENGIGRL